MEKLESKQNWFIGGDFNAHNPVWQKDNPSSAGGGTQLLEHINASNLILLNDGTATRYPTQIEHKMTAIDITLCSPDLLENYMWTVHPDPLGSDHCPISIQLDAEAETIEQTHTEHYNYEKANWDEFRLLLDGYSSSSLKDDKIEIYYQNIRKTILTSSNETIPKYKMTEQMLKIKVG